MTGVQTCALPISVVLVQSPSGKFTQKTLPLKATEQMKEEDMGVLLFDADGDGDNDLYVVRGSYQHDPQSPLYQYVLCENDGKGNFTEATQAVFGPVGIFVLTAQGGFVADLNHDGRMDLIITDYGSDYSCCVADPAPGGTRVFIQTSDGRLVDESATRAPLRDSHTQIGRAHV